MILDKGIHDMSGNYKLFGIFFSHSNGADPGGVLP